MTDTQASATAAAWQVPIRELVARIPLVMTAKDMFFDENCDLYRMLA